MKTQITAAPNVQQFIIALKRVADEVENVAKMLVAMVDANPKIYDEIVKADPRISHNLLGNLERVGRGQTYGALLFDSSPGARKLLALPISQQKELYEKPVSIVRWANGKSIVEQKSIQQLSRQEANLLIDDGDRVRSIEEQIKYVNPAPAKVSHRAHRYEIKDGKLRVFPETEFTMTELEEIITRMKAKSIESLEVGMKSGQIRK